MVAYWGQNGVYAIHKERQKWEKELDYFCKSHSYDVVVLAFNHIFFDRRNKGKILYTLICNDAIFSFGYFPLKVAGSSPLLLLALVLRVFFSQASLF